MRRLLLLAALAVLVPAPAAHALPILGEADSADLVEQLDEARQATGVCFGWQVRVDDETGQFSGIDGSPLIDIDVGLDAEQRPPCERELTLRGLLVYTSEASSFEDSADISLEQTGFPGADLADLERLTDRSADDLLGGDDDKVLYELVAALPLLAAELDPALAGKLPAVETGGAPSDAAVGKSPGSDWLRTYWYFVLFSVLLGLLAAWLIASGVRGRRAAARTPRPRRA